MRIYDDVTQLVGGTPLVRLQRLGADLPGKVLVKLESFNPLSSVKDRIGLNMIKAAEAAEDFVSRELMESILESEEEHVDWLETQLGLIERVGLQNYNQSQMGDGGS